MNALIHRNVRVQQLSAACALLLATFFSGAASAKPLDQITVQAPKIVVTQIGRNSNGFPVEELSLRVRIDSSGLDLADLDGMSGMEARINAAAHAACAEISRAYPLAEPGDAACAAAAARPALNKVRALALRAPAAVRVREFTLAR